MSHAQAEWLMSHRMDMTWNSTLVSVLSFLFILQEWMMGFVFLVQSKGRTANIANFQYRKFAKLMRF
jgi:hypothetical protein